MPTYKVTDPTTGKTLRLTGGSPPTEQELNDIFSKQAKSAPAIPTRAKPREAFGMELPEDFKAKHPYATAGYETLKEGLAVPALHLLDVASLGTISGAARKVGEVLPEAKTAPGKVLETAGKGVGLFKSALLKAIGRLRVPGVKGALETGKITRPVAGAVTGAARGAIAGAAVSPSDITDIEARKKQALTGGVIGSVAGAIGGTVQNLLARKPEKVNQIREGMREYWKKTSTEYGKLMKQAGIEGGEIDPIDTLDFMEKELVDRGILDRAGNKIASGQTKVDRAFLKAYEDLRDKFYAAGGKVPAIEVVSAARKVEAAGRKASKFRPTELGTEARKLKTGIEETFKANLRNEGKSFEEAQRLWAKMRSEFDLVDKHFNIWENNLATGKGEQALSKIMSNGELRAVGKIIEQQTGVSLTNDKIISVITSPALRGTYYTLGIVGGIIYAIKGGRGEAIPTTSR